MGYNTGGRSLPEPGARKRRKGNEEPFQAGIQPDHLFLHPDEVEDGDGSDTKPFTLDASTLDDVQIALQDHYRRTVTTPDCDGQLSWVIRAAHVYADATFHELRQHKQTANALLKRKSGSELLALMFELGRAFERVGVYARHEELIEHAIKIQKKRPGVQARNKWVCERAVELRENPEPTMTKIVEQLVEEIREHFPEKLWVGKGMLINSEHGVLKDLDLARPKKNNL